MESRRSLFRRALGVAAAPSMMFVEPKPGESPANVEVGSRYCMECGLIHLQEIRDGRIVVQEQHAPGCRYA